MLEGSRKLNLFQWVRVVSEALRCVCFIVGFLTEHARGLSSFPTLDTERMWRRKAWPPHRSHCDLGVWCGAKRPAQGPQRNQIHYRLCYLKHNTNTVFLHLAIKTQYLWVMSKMEYWKSPERGQIPSQYFDQFLDVKHNFEYFMIAELLVFRPHLSLIFV